MSRAWLLTLVSLVLTSCTLQQASKFAWLEIDGPNVFLNGERVPEKVAIDPGATVRTGEGSSARLQFFDGSRLQLAPNSDPTVGDDGEAITVAGADDGEYRATTGRWNIRWIGSILRGLMSSDVIIHAERGQRIELFVLSGAFDPEAPDLAPVAAGQSLTVTADGEVTRGTISFVERVDLIGDFNRWDFRERADQGRDDPGDRDDTPAAPTGPRDDGPVVDGP